MKLTREDYIVGGTIVAGLALIFYLASGKANATLSPYVEPLNNIMEGPGYMAYNAPKTYIPQTSTGPCGCGASGTTLFGSINELSTQMLSQASAVLANMRSS